MTASAPSPACPQGAPPVDTRSKRMVAFYVSTGVACLLLVGFYFAWTPLRVWYWERQAREGRETYEDMSYKVDIAYKAVQGEPDLPRSLALIELLRIGEPACPAIERLLSSHGQKGSCKIMRIIERDTGDLTWLLPLISEHVKYEKSEVTHAALSAAGRIAGKSFVGDWDDPETFDELVEDGRGKFLEWWEREGKAKYGRAER